MEGFMNQSFDFSCTALNFLKSDSHLLKKIALFALVKILYDDENAFNFIFKVVFDIKILSCFCINFLVMQKK